MNENKLARGPFVNQMTRAQTILGWCYVPMHLVVLPLLLQLYAAYSLAEWDTATVNLWYLGIGIVFIAIVMGIYLRRQYDVLADNLLRCMLALLSAFAAYYIATILEGVIVLLLGDSFANPNNEAIGGLIGENYGVMKGLTIFIAPIVEEVLFRGVIFGSIRTRSRVLAYGVSTLLFCFMHVWQYALTEPVLLLYALQYVPIALILDWSYERSGSVWIPIFFHMANNAVSFAILSFYT